VHLSNLAGRLFDNGAKPFHPGPNAIIFYRLAQGSSCLSNDQKIYPFSAPAIVRRRWAVRAHVDRVVSGTFSGDTFTFTVHSPAQSGLRVGRAYTIKATWTIEGYVVDESTLQAAAVRAKPSAKR